jgi:hypothetical protein
MRPASLNYYVYQGKPESEVAPGRNCVPKLRSEVASLILSEAQGQESEAIRHTRVRPDRGAAAVRQFHIGPVALSAEHGLSPVLSASTN